MKSTSNIDILNIGLILLSLVIAIFLPFRLFLMSYAILGPLHYLTEINWLHKRNYYMKSDIQWIIALLIITFLVSIYPVANYINGELSESISEVVNFTGRNRGVLILTGFLFSIGLVFFKKTAPLLMFLLLSFLISIGLNYLMPMPLYLTGLFVPTIIHVYLFTLLFMIYGAIKSKSKFGMYSIILMILVPIGILFLNVTPSDYAMSVATEKAYTSTNITDINVMIAKIFGGVQHGKYLIYSEMAIKIQIFIAFSFTYHYVNWLSKTSVIGWKKLLSTRTTLLFFLIWVGTLYIYYIDYKTGLIALFFLSLLHVILEFPLNVVSIKELLFLGKRK